MKDYVKTGKPDGARVKTQDMAYIALFAVIIAICAWISVPAEIPFTLQTFGVFLAVGVLGGKRGTLSVLIYLLLGMAGVPVLAGFTGGIGHYAGNTGGYLVGFLFAALVMWAMERFLGKKLWVLALSMVVGMAVYYVFGTVWFMVLYSRRTGAIGVWAALSMCVIPYIVPDVIKIVLALSVSRKLQKVIRIDR